MGSHAQSVGGAAHCLAGTDREARRGARLSRQARRAAPQTPRGASSARLVPTGTCAVTTRARRLLQHGIHAERGAAHLFRRPRQRGGRSVEGRVRSGGARGWRGTVVQPRIFPPGHRHQWRPAGAVSLQRSGTAAHHAVSRPQRRVAAPAVGSARTHDLGASVAGARRTREAVSPGYQRHRQLPGVPRYHERAVWRRTLFAADAGDRARHRGLAVARDTGSEARSLSPE